MPYLHQHWFVRFRVQKTDDDDDDEEQNGRTYGQTDGQTEHIMPASACVHLRKHEHEIKTEIKSKAELEKHCVYSPPLPL